MLYLYSFTADLFDGMAARKFNQCSTFGGLLDMVTDRCSTLGLLFVLYGEYGAIGESHFELYRLVRSIFFILTSSF
jgi:phosphatidylglycerophosphate synthase